MTPANIVDQYGRELKRDFTALQLEQIIIRERRGATAPTGMVSWYYSAITIISLSYAQLPWKLWKQDRTARRGRKPGYVEVFNHRRLTPRLKRPHPQMSFIRWRMQWAAKLLDGGNVFVIPDEVGPDGVTKGLMIFGRDRINPIRESVDAPLLGWQFNPGGGRDPIALPVDAVMHWALPNPYDPVMGLAPKDAIRMTMDAEFAREIFEKSFYQNAANPSAILRHTGAAELTPEQRAEVRQAWEEFYTGPDKAGRVAVLAGDWDFTVWSFQQSQSQFVDTKKVSREAIAAAMLGFPVGFLNAQENGGLSRAGEEADRLKLYENCTFPLARIFEPEFNHGFVQRVDPTVECAFDMEQVPVALVYAEMRSKIYERYVKNGIPPNAVIENMDLPFDPIEGGDIGLVNAAFIPLTAAGEHEKSDPTPESTDVALAEVGTDPEKAVEAKPRSLPEPLRPLVRRLRESVKKTLFEIRHAVKSDDRTNGSTVEDRRRWSRRFLPAVAVAVRVGADGTEAEYLQKPAGVIDAALREMQARAEALEIPMQLESSCEWQVRRLVRFFDGVMRDAASAAEPAMYLRGSDSAARDIAERVIRDSVRAGSLVVANWEEAA